mgnify:CR=1 FL=1
MQEYLLIQREQQKEKREIVMAMRLAEASRLRYGDDALEFLSGAMVEKITEEEALALIEELEKNK